MLPHKTRKIDNGKASYGSNSCIPKKKEDYIVPPPIPHAFDNAELILKVSTSITSSGYIGKKPLNTHFWSAASH